MAAAEWPRAVRRFLDRLDADGQDARAVRAAMGDPGQPCFEVDTELLGERWYPDPPA